jgi:xanthine dehydrogenase accessory factor
MRAELLQLAAELARRGEPFVLAVVVRREPHSSAQPGDMAVITATGAYHGWIGGACAAPTVRREAQRVLADGRPRLLSLSPEPALEARHGVTALPITCHSGGTVDIFLEPVVAAPRVRVFGESPAARALAAVGKAMGYTVELVAPGLTGATGVDRLITDLAGDEARATCREPLYAVVATMGEFDEDALAAALAARPLYVGVVASRRRFAEIRELLLERGTTAAELDRVHNPAGLDIGARRPEELAVSVFAEIVQVQAAAAARPGPERVEVSTAAPDRAVDPICGMSVQIAGARHVAELDGAVHYFCCARCRERFLAGQHEVAAARAGD